MTYAYDSGRRTDYILLIFAPERLDGQFAIVRLHLRHVLAAELTESTIDGAWETQPRMLTMPIGQLTHAAFASTNPGTANQDLTYLYDAAGEPYSRPSSGGSNNGLYKLTANNEIHPNRLDDLNTATISNGNLHFSCEPQIPVVDELCLQLKDILNLSGVTGMNGAWTATIMMNSAIKPARQPQR